MKDHVEENSGDLKGLSAVVFKSWMEGNKSPKNLVPKPTINTLVDFVRVMKEKLLEMR